MTTEQVQAKIAQSSQKQSEASTTKSAVDASRQRVDAALASRGIRVPGPKPGGLSEAMSDPAALEASRALVARKRQNMQMAKDVAGVKTVKRSAREIDSASFNFTADERANRNNVVVGRNPNVAARTPGFLSRPNTRRK